MHTHDPTTLNRQGNDVGTRIAVSSLSQRITKEIADKYIDIQMNEVLWQ